MRVSLFHNQKAGDCTSLSWIRELIETSGHELVRVFDREAAFGELVDTRTELVVAAGGDGTVSTAARLLAGSDVPLAVLPLGTANNIAKALHDEASSEDLVAGWETAARRRFDLGIARGQWGQRRFLEAVGVGLIPAVISSTLVEPIDGDVASKLADATARYSRVLADLGARRWTITLDGHAMVGDYLLVEVLNTRSLGPNIVWSLDADPFDGYFSVVVAGESQRESLIRYLEDRSAGREGDPGLMALRARDVEIRGPGDLHVDDEVVCSSLSDTISIRMEAGAVEFLVGADGTGATG